LQLVKNRGFEPVIIPNGYLERWSEMLPIYLLGMERKEFSDILRALSVFYNLNFYLNDNKAPAYRHVLIINKIMGPESPSFDGLVSARPETDEDFEFRKQLLGAYLEQIKCLFRMVGSDDGASFLEELAQRNDEVKKLEVKLNEKIAHEAAIRDNEGRYLTRWVNFEFCSSCNLRCKWCSLDHSKKRSLMTREILAKTLDELAANPKFDIDRIDLHNAGEVLLHPDLEGMLRVIKEKRGSFRRKPTVHLLTNATLLDERRTAIIIDADVLDEIRFSIDGGNLNNYREIRRGADWETVKSNVLNFIAQNREKGKKIKTGVICIVPPEMSLKTYWMDDDFRALFSRIDNVELRHPHNWDGSEDLHLERKKYKTEGRLCKFLLKDLVILPNGDVTVCCADLNSRGVIGNVSKNSLEDIYLSARRLDMLDLYRKGKMENITLCKNCAGYYE
jgi:radical SAM protein with 4Fe4S-binding SPASM domain